MRSVRHRRIGTAALSKRNTRPRTLRSVSFPSLATGSSSNLGPFSETVYLAIIAALVVWLIVYLAYKLRMTSKRDFGFPVRRRLLCLHLTVHDNQQADVPFWWTDLQVQRAVKSYWRRSLRSETEQS
jgi:amino acid permease